MEHFPTSRLSLAYKEFDAGAKPATLRKKNRFRGLAYGTLFYYHFLWKGEGGLRKRDIINEAKRLFRMKVIKGDIKEDQIKIIPDAIKVLHKKEYHWYADKTPADAIRAAIEEVETLPPCLWSENGFE